MASEESSDTTSDTTHGIPSENREFLAKRTTKNRPPFFSSSFPSMSSFSPFRVTHDHPVDPIQAPAVNHVVSSVVVGGNTGTSIPASVLGSQAIIVTPASINQTYTLPTASAILSAFGLRNGLAYLEAGAYIPIQVINASAFPAYILSNPTGGDGSAAIAYGTTAVGGNGALSTGAVGVAAHKTDVLLRFSNVGVSANGATGTYSIFI